jgi:hypothetical protein
VNQSPPTRNTRLSIAARNALKPVFGEATAATIEKQVEAGMLSLADLDHYGEMGEGTSKGVVSVIFGPGNPQEIALACVEQSARSRDCGEERRGRTGGVAARRG